MAENEDQRQEVVEEPATHKKKAQAFLFALLGILLVVMIVDVIRKSGSSEEAEGDKQPVAAVATAPVDVRSFDQRVEEAKRAQAFQQKVEARQPSPAEVVAQVEEERQQEKQRRLGWGPVQKEKTPAEIYLEAEQMRVLESRRSKLVVQLKETRGAVKAAPASAPGAYPRNQGLTKERGYIEEELARVRQMQEQLMTGGAPSAGAAGLAQPSNVTAQNAPEFQVGQPVAEQPQPKPGQVLLSTGTVISAALDQMTMSDVTGAFRAIVTRDVYDPTQRFVLVPKGAKLVGKTIRVKGVNEPIQNRMVLTLNWCVLPNGKRISFNKTVAMDAAGVSALKDRVNYHLIPQVLGVAAYALLSSETSRSGSGDNSDSTYAGDIGASMREQFAPLASKYLNLVPTVTLRPGLPMRVFIEDDLYITPWDRVYAGVIPSA